jgi:hypothetical protein
MDRRGSLRRRVTPRWSHPRQLPSRRAQRASPAATITTNATAQELTFTETSADNQSIKPYGRCLSWQPRCISPTVAKHCKTVAATINRLRCHPVSIDVQPLNLVTPAADRCGIQWRSNRHRVDPDLVSVALDFKGASATRAFLRPRHREAARRSSSSRSSLGSVRSITAGGLLSGWDIRLRLLRYEREPQRGPDVGTRQSTLTVRRGITATGVTA